MDISGVGRNSIEIQTRELGNLLKDITNASLDLENKMNDFNVAEQVSNTGGNFDSEA